MLILSLAAVARGPVRLHDEIPTDESGWHAGQVALEGPLRVDLEARGVGEGVLVRGRIEARVRASCRRCLAIVPVDLRDTVDLLFEPLSAADELELGGEVYPLPDRGDRIELDEAIREQVMLRLPDYVLCSEACRGLCPRCGADLNRAPCACVPTAPVAAWDALKKIKFD